jgi:hypothetical protein
VKATRMCRWSTRRRAGRACPASAAPPSGRRRRFRRQASSPDRGRDVARGGGVDGLAEVNSLRRVDNAVGETGSCCFAFQDFFCFVLIFIIVCRSFVRVYFSNIYIIYKKIFLFYYCLSQFCLSLFLKYLYYL